MYKQLMELFKDDIDKKVAEGEALPAEKDK